MHSSDPSSFLGPGPDYVSQIIGRIGTKLEKHVLDGHRRHFIGIHLKRVPLITFTSHALQKPNDDKVAFGRTGLLRPVVVVLSQYTRAQRLEPRYLPPSSQTLSQCEWSVSLKGFPRVL